MHARVAVAGAVLMLALGLSAARGAAQAKVDVTGKWAFNVETSAGAGTPTFTFKQDGEKLTGHYTGTFGEADLTGTVKGADITFSFTVDARAPPSRTTPAQSTRILRGNSSSKGSGGAPSRRKNNDRHWIVRRSMFGVRRSSFVVRRSAFGVRRFGACIGSVRL
jgi:hypothetical protein